MVQDGHRVARPTGIPGRRTLKTRKTRACRYTKPRGKPASKRRSDKRLQHFFKKFPNKACSNCNKINFLQNKSCRCGELFQQKKEFWDQYSYIWTDAERSTGHIIGEIISLGVISDYKEEHLFLKPNIDDIPYGSSLIHKLYLKNGDLKMKDTTGKNCTYKTLKTITENTMWESVAEHIKYFNSKLIFLFYYGEDFLTYISSLVRCGMIETFRGFQNLRFVNVQRFLEIVREDGHAPNLAALVATYKNKVPELKSLLSHDAFADAKSLQIIIKFIYGEEFHNWIKHIILTKDCLSMRDAEENMQNQYIFTNKVKKKETGEKYLPIHYIETVLLGNHEEEYYEY